MTTKAQFDVLGVGVLAVDDMLYVDHYPQPDHKAEIARTARNFGGLIGTAIAAAGRLGARCAYAGLLDQDELSQSIRHGLEEAGVDCSLVVHRKGARPCHAIIIVDDSAHTRTILYTLDGLTPLDEQDMDEKLIGSAKVLLTDQMNYAGVIRVAGIARRLGVPIVADMEWQRDAKFDAMMPVVDHLIVPRDFGAFKTGLSEAHDIVLELHRRHARACTAVTCGVDGCYYVDGAEAARPGGATSADVLHVPAFAVKTVETTGCGDVFHGAYAAALAKGHGVHECLVRAAAAAAVYASRPNGWQHLATGAEVNQLIGESVNR
jgi:sulfofructose kinase